MEFNNNLQSGEEYSLSDLFSSPDRKIIIPDFQRDYCWGDKLHGEKNDKDIVSGFIEVLFEEFDKNKYTDLIIGKIDAYEYPKNHIYLTDGQQRITTLYLLIGILFMRTKSKKLKPLLISEYEAELDDKEPYIQYAIRESTIFFLRDLVNNFFISDQKLSVSKIKIQSWYFDDFTFDPTIISMINAMEIIETAINLKKLDENEFSEFIASKIKMQYYDVENIKYGEQRFIIINTTGENLTLSENIKPILIGGVTELNYANQWEERETWFWKNRKNTEQIADYGVNNFLTWFYQIKTNKEKVDLIVTSKKTLSQGEQKNIAELKQIDEYFKSLKILIELLKEGNIQSLFEFINENEKVSGISGIRALNTTKTHNIILPLLSFITNISIDKQDIYIFLRRLRKNYFDLIWVERKENYIDWRYILQIIEKNNSTKSLEKILLFDTLKDLNEISNVDMPKLSWYNEEEKLKFSLRLVNSQLIHTWEDQLHFMGDLSALFKVSDNSLDINVLAAFVETYKSLQLNSLFKNKEISNKYRFYDLLYRGELDTKKVDGLWYCMLKQSEKFLLYNISFLEIWKKVNNNLQNENTLVNFFNEKIKCYFTEKVFNDNLNSIENIINDTSEIRSSDLIKIWLLFEVFNNKNEILGFSNSVACFWEYPNLLKVANKSDFKQNDYRLGNLLLGTSYKYNKTRRLDYSKFPLMQEIYNNRDKITEDDIISKTILYKNLLLSVINN